VQLDHRLEILQIDEHIEEWMPKNAVEACCCLSNSYQDEVRTMEILQFKLKAVVWLNNQI
jgi:hypothetical protein